VITVKLAFDTVFALLLKAIPGGSPNALRWPGIEAFPC